MDNQSSKQCETYCLLCHQQRNRGPRPSRRMGRMGYTVQGNIIETRSQALQLEGQPPEEAVQN